MADNQMINGGKGYWIFQYLDDYSVLGKIKKVQVFTPAPFYLK